MEITRKLFGMNGQMLEYLPVCSKETFEKWKSGELSFLFTENCFASTELTEERIHRFPDLLTENVDEDEANKFRSAWGKMSLKNKQIKYNEYMKYQYGACNYEEFRKRDDVWHLELPVMVGEAEGVLFCIVKPKNPVGMAV